MRRALLVVALSACDATPSRARAPVDPALIAPVNGGVVATVVGSPRYLSLDRLRRRVALETYRKWRERTEVPGSWKENPHQLFQRVLDEELDALVMREHAEKRGVTLDEREIAEERESLKKYELTEPDLTEIAVDTVTKRKLTEYAGKLKIRSFNPDYSDSDDTVRARYAEWSADKRNHRTEFRLLTITFTDSSKDDRWEQARALRERMRKGEDFCKLVEQYSQDLETKSTCGAHARRHGEVPLGSLDLSYAQFASRLGAMEISEPFEMSGKPTTTGSVVIMQMVKPPRAPPYEEVSHQLQMILIAEQMDVAFQRWCREELRTRYPVTLRLTHTMSEDLEESIALTQGVPWGRLGRQRSSAPTKKR